MGKKDDISDELRDLISADSKEEVKEDNLVGRVGVKLNKDLQN